MLEALLLITYILQAIAVVDYVKNSGSLFNTSSPNELFTVLGIMFVPLVNLLIFALVLGQKR